MIGSNWFPAGNLDITGACSRTETLLQSSIERRITIWARNTVTHTLLVNALHLRANAFYDPAHLCTLAEGNTGLVLFFEIARHFRGLSPSTPGNNRSPEAAALPAMARHTTSRTTAAGTVSSSRGTGPTARDSIVIVEPNVTVLVDGVHHKTAANLDSAFASGNRFWIRARGSWWSRTGRVSLVAEIVPKVNAIIVDKGKKIFPTLFPDGIPTQPAAQGGAVGAVFVEDQVAGIAGALGREAEGVVRGGRACHANRLVEGGVFVAGGGRAVRGRR